MKIKSSYTKAAKEHIIQMAARKMFKVEFCKKYAELEEALTVKAESMGDHEEILKSVPNHLLKHVVKSQQASYYGNCILTVNNHIALECNHKIRSIPLNRAVYINARLAAELVDADEVKEFNKYLKTLDAAIQDIEVAVNSYRTYNKAVEALPWIEGFHPDYMKAPACNIVPISTINKVNELMSALK